MNLNGIGRGLVGRIDLAVLATLSQKEGGTEQASSLCGKKKKDLIIHWKSDKTRQQEVGIWVYVLRTTDNLNSKYLRLKAPVKSGLVRQIGFYSSDLILATPGTIRVSSISLRDAGILP